MTRAKRTKSPETTADEDPADFAPELPAKQPGAKVFAEIAAATDSFRQARTVLKRVRAVPTIFPYLDLKLRVGGWPIDRVGMLHGPSGKGKTTLAHGLGLSFLRRRHMYALIDAEYTTPYPWLLALLGAYADSSAFVATRPKTYEEAVDGVRGIARGLQKAKAAKRLPADTSCLFVVDSLTKLVPEGLWARIKAQGAQGDKGSVDGYGGGAGRMKAAMNATWLNELTPLMYETGCSTILIVRETEDGNASAQDKRFGSDWKTGGGKAVFFDSSYALRVSQATMVKASAADDAPIVGERHKVEIYKTKVSAREDYKETCYFHTSNGLVAPEGFDTARDLLEVGKELGVVKTSGSWVSYGGHRWQGESRFVASAQGELLAKLEADVRAKFVEDAAARAEVVGG